MKKSLNTKSGWLGPISWLCLAEATYYYYQLEPYLATNFKAAAVSLSIYTFYGCLKSFINFRLVSRISLNSDLATVSIIDTHGNKFEVPINSLQMTKFTPKNNFMFCKAGRDVFKIHIGGTSNADLSLLYAII